MKPVAVAAARVLEVPLSGGGRVAALVSLPREYLDAVGPELAVLRPAASELAAEGLVQALPVDIMTIASLPTPAEGDHPRLLGLGDSLAMVADWPRIEDGLLCVRELLGAATDSEMNQLLLSARLGAIQAACHTLLDRLGERRDVVAQEFAAMVSRPLARLLFTPAG